ncbi:MAG: endonuclease [bacterium]
MVSFPKTKKIIPRRLTEIYNILLKSHGPQHWWPGDTPFEIMTGAVLTQNTNWLNVSKAINNLKDAGLLDPEKLLRNRKKVSQLVKPSGFYRLKGQRLLAFCEYYVTRYQANTKQMKKRNLNYLRNELTSIKGIGKETADSILLYALDRPVFVVDAYTRRIFSRHDYFGYDDSYDEIRLLFERNLPRKSKIYNEYHALLVKLGKTKCKKNEPLCNTCPLQYI